MRTPKKKTSTKKKISPCRSPINTRSRTAKCKTRTPKKSPKPSPRSSPRKSSPKKCQPKLNCIEQQISQIAYTNYFMDITCEQRVLWNELRELVFSIRNDFLNSQLKMPEFIPSCSMLQPVCEQIKYFPDCVKTCASELAELENVLENCKEILSILWIYENINILIDYNNSKYKGENLMAVGGEGIVISAKGNSPCNCDQEFIIKMVPYSSKDNVCSMIEELKKLASIKAISGIVQPVTPLITFETEDTLVYACVFPKYGPTLSHLQKYENFVFTDEFCKWAVRQILAILTKIHNKGYIHLDIHPSNILLGPYIHDHNTYEPKLYLIDFGISELSNRKTENFGTIKYASPYIRERPVNYKDDYISLIFTIWYLNKGYLPWIEDTNDYEVMKKKKDFLEEGVYKEDIYLHIL